MKLNSRIFHIAGAVIFVPVVLFSVAALFIYFQSDTIKEKILAELNKNTGANASIQGKVELSFFKHFPNVALELKGVLVQGSVDTTTQPLLKADRIYLLANFWDVARGDWKIQSTSIENGQFFMLRTKEGIVNYLFDTGKGDSLQPVAFSIDVERALLKNIRYRLLDEISEVDIDVQVDDASVSGNFTSENLSLHAVADVFAHSVKIRGTDYADEKHVSFDGSLAIATEKNSYALNVKQFLIEKNEFAINGTITMVNDNPVFDLAVRGKDIAVGDIPQLLPSEYVDKLNGIKGTGSMQLSAEIKGALDKKNNPAITITGSATRATLQIPGMEGKITNLSFFGSFSNGSKQNLSTSTIAIRDFKAKMKQGELNGKFSVSHLEKPHLKVDVDGALELSILNKFLADNARLKEITGLLDFKNVHYSGKVADLQAFRLAGLEGAVAVSRLEMRLDDAVVKIPAAKLAAYDNVLTIEKFDAQLPSTNLSLTGKIEQMPGLVAGKKGNAPKVVLTLRAESIHVPEVLALMQGKENIQEKKKETEPMQFLGNINVQANHIAYNKFNAYDVTGSVLLEGDRVELKNFSCNTVDGLLDFSSTITMRSGNFITKTHATGSEINVREMFAQFENFNQETITDNNLSGKMNFTADVSADFINGKLDEKKLAAVVDLVVKQGELINLKSLENLSRFIDIEDLRHIRFSTLKNKISISNQTVFIPEMLVESNAINIAVAGSQTFKGAINYSVKLNLFDVLGKKIRKRKDLNEYEEVGQNEFNFYLSLTGTTSNPVVKYDKKSWKERIAQQKQEFRELRDEQEVMQQQQGFKEKTIFTNKRKKDEKQEEDVEYIEWDEQP